MQSNDTHRIESTLASWPGVHVERLDHDDTDFLIGCREIGHLHSGRQVDIPFPRPVRDELVASGRAQPHHLLVKSGWVTVPIQSLEDIETAIELLKLSYDLAQNSR